MNWKVIIIILVVASFLAGWLIMRSESPGNLLTAIPSPSVFISARPSATPSPTIRATPIAPGQSIVLNVPFAAQAPFGNWSDPRQQDGCEEAAALMALRWVRGQSVTAQEALDEIIAISAFEEKNYGSYHDTSAQDTVNRIFKDYYGYDRVTVRSDITAEDIKSELSDGKIIIVPANGRLLGNPNFTPPGPERHMLVVKGYDYNRKEFITNDPGTRQGKDYRYPEAVLFEAIRNYSTGYHEPIIGTEKTMIVVSR